MRKNSSPTISGMQELKLCWIEMLVEITTKNLCKVVHIAVTKNRLCLKLAVYPKLHKKQRVRRVPRASTPEGSDRLASQKSPLTEGTSWDAMTSPSS